MCHFVSPSFCIINIIIHNVNATINPLASNAENNIIVLLLSIVAILTRIHTLINFKNKTLNVRAPKKGYVDTYV